MNARKYIILLVPVLLALGACSGQNGPNDSSAPTTKLGTGNPDPNSNPHPGVTVPAGDPGPPPGPVPRGMPLNGKTIGLTEVNGLLENGTCKLTVRLLNMSEADQSSFNDMLTAFARPTQECPRPDVKVSPETVADPCAERTTQAADHSGKVAVQPDKCLPPIDVQRSKCADSPTTCGTMPSDPTQTR